MTSNRVLRRLAPPVIAFIVATSGAVIMFNSSSRAVVAAPEQFPTVVAITDLKPGSTLASLVARTEIRRLPAEARAAGALASLDELPADAVITSAMVAGQQILTSSVGADPRSSVGAGLVAVSAKLDPQQWAGPVAISGNRVDVYAVDAPAATLIARGVTVLEAPDPTTLAPQQEAVIILGVAPSEVAAVIGAISGSGIWLVTA